MSHSEESELVQTLEFKWGKKRGRGVKNKKIQFYESFTYDGVEYTLYDIVHLYKKGEPEPYIGKLISIFENEETKAKGVKVHWFFRYSEISNWIEEGMTLLGEIFLASGEGACVASATPLESICGKCNVVCTSEDKRNTQPSAPELASADYFFYRTFDVEHYTISDIKGDKVAGLEVKFVFNRKENKGDTGPISDKKQEGEKPSSLDTKKTGDVVRSSLGRLSIVNNDAKPLTKSSSFTDKLKNRERRVPKGLDKVVKADKSVPTTKHENKETSQKLLASSDKNGGKDLASSSFTDRRKESAGLENVLKPEDKENCHKLSGNSDNNGRKDLATSFKKRKSNDDLGPDKEGKLQRTEEKMTKLSNEKLRMVSAGDSAHEERSEFGEFAVTRRPIDERSKWFRALPWEERIKNAYKEGTIIQLSNLDPKYTSSEIEDLIWHAFKEHCTAKMVQCTANSSPYHGYAHIIMKTRQAADLVLKKLEDGCLMLPNKRPLVASRAPPLNFPGKQSTFIGHLFVDKTKHLRQRETTEAVSTSHCSQPNTIEFEMALEWSLLQSRSDCWWKELNKRQGEELKRLKANLKLK